MDTKIRPWTCTGNREHVLGQVVRNGSGVRQLLLYREAVNMGDLTPSPSPTGRGEEEVDVMAVVEGYVADVRCSICGAVRTWVPGQEAMERLLRQVAALRQPESAGK